MPIKVINISEELSDKKKVPRRGMKNTVYRLDGKQLLKSSIEKSDAQSFSTHNFSLEPHFCSVSKIDERKQDENVSINE